MKSASQRFIGRRREILDAIKGGYYREWLLREYQRRQQVQRFNLFREGIRARFIQLEVKVVPEPEPELDTIEPDVAVVFPASAQRRWSPEQRMWGSVLIRSIYDVVNFHLDPAREDGQKKPTKLQTRMGAEVHIWLFQNEEYIGSFPWICSMLSVGHYRKLRERIVQLKREDLPRQCASAKKKSEDM